MLRLPGVQIWDKRGIYPLNWISYLRALHSNMRRQIPAEGRGGGARGEDHHDADADAGTLECSTENGAKSDDQGLNILSRPVAPLPSRRISSDHPYCVLCTLVLCALDH